MFPGVEEDMASQKQNDLYQVRFSKFALLNIPEQSGTTLDPESAFVQSGSSVTPATFGDALVESLRNYIANHVTTIRNSRTGATSYFYDTNELGTVTERAFWKWAKSLNLIEFEPASSTEDWTASISEFDNTGPAGNVDYHREYVWRERKTPSMNILTCVESPASTVNVVFETSTNLRPGDVVDFEGLTGVTSGTVVTVSTTTDANDTITFSGSYAGGGTPLGATGTLRYSRFLQYIGEVPGSNTVTKSDSTYTQVYAHVPANAGLTPTPLFRTVADENYKPSMTYPILSSQRQPEIQGGENPSNPLLTNPSAYPGDWYGQFDDTGYVYKTKSGDASRRFGEYFGVTVVSNIGVTPMYPDLDGSTIDGIELDFNIEHYVPASAVSPVCTNFDELSTANIGGDAPLPFEFNAVLWYYDIIDNTGSTQITKTNLYGIQILKDPGSDAVLPTKEKLVSNEDVDGTSYTLSFDTFNYLDSDSIPQFDPDRVFGLAEFDLYYEAMNRLALLNDQFSSLLSNVTTLTQTVINLQGLLYTQQSLDGINQRMDSLETLLGLYKTLQIGGSETIEAVLDNDRVRLNSVDRRYSSVTNILSTDLFAKTSGPLVVVTSTPKIIPITSAKDMLVLVTNDDPGISPDTYDPGTPVPQLEVRLEKDLSFRQTIDFIIQANSDSIEDKGLKISVAYNDDTTTDTVVMETVDMPVFLLPSGSAAQPYSSYRSGRSFQPSAIYYTKAGSFRYLVIDVLANLSDVIDGTRIQINGMTVHETPGTPGDGLDISGSYTVDSDASFVETGCVNASLVKAGSGYTTTSSYYVANLLPINNATFASDIAAKVGVTFTAGSMTAVKLLNPGYGFKPNDTALYGLVGSTVTALTPGSLTAKLDAGVLDASWATVIPSDGSRAIIRLDVVPITRIRLDVTSMSEFTSAYDALFAASSYTSAPDNTLYPIDPYIMSNPTLKMNVGYVVSITRINDAINTPSTDWRERYRTEVRPL